jgi:hypothetical protein
MTIKRMIKKIKDRKKHQTKKKKKQIIPLMP